MMHKNRFFFPSRQSVRKQCFPSSKPFYLISIQASCGSDDHVAECESTEEAKTGNNKPFFCWQRKGRKSLWGEGLSQIDVNTSLKYEADVNGGVSQGWLKEVKQEEVCQKATN